MFRCGSLPQPGVSITVATSPSHCSSTTASELGLLEFAKGATSSCSSVTASSSEMGSAAGSELDGSENDEESVARPAVARAHKLTSARLVPIAEFESRMETTLAWMLGMEEHLIRNSGEDNLVTRKRWRKRGDGNRRITSSLLGSGVETRNSPLLKDPSSATRSTEMSGEPAIEQQKETLGVLEREAGEEGEYTEEEEDEEDDEDVQKQVEWIKDSDFFAVEETSDIQHLAELARLSFSGRIGGEPSVGVSSTGSHSVTNPAPEGEALVERIHQRLLDRLDMAKKRFETHEVGISWIL
ncbi:unnamed protein product [Protopolystoma xenopodis]|uniref:Uncharacterized protein n=1 Tax=Protopolystoma xenopodis TaxID=117903 RepID=A0A3S4ZJ26_9PLAT|nr:unnamed protein product [Protopolystoma xenopodis]